MKKIINRFKKTITRFKKWLIRKLGGYTEIFNTVVKKEYVAVPLHPQKLMAAYDVYSEDLISMRGFEDYVKNNILSSMSDQIFNVMYVERMDDFRDHRIHFRASLWVIPSADISKLENKEWRKS